MGAFYADWRQRDVSFQKVKVSFLTQKYEKHIRVHSLSVEILCFTTLQQQPGSQEFPQKIGRGGPSQFPERKIANELASTSNLYLFECSILSRQVTRTMVTRQYFLVSKILSMRPLNGQKHDEIFRYENF